MNAVQIFTLAGASLVLGIFATWLAYRRPKGVQPGAWGHLQTLADLIDEWEVSKSGGRLWWGDKGEIVLESGEIVRHAGTSGNITRLGVIRESTLYF